MPIKVVINGFGRIGRPTFKELIKNKNIEVVAINDLTDNQTLAHLLKYDSLYGIYDKEVKATDEDIQIDGKKYKSLSEKDPANLPWKELDVDVVLECTGLFRTYEDAEKHIKAGAKKVIISAPAKSDNIPTFVPGVNQDKYNPEDNILSMASCTTNCLAPITKVINDNLEIQRAAITTIHSYTSSQNIVDGPHKDLRRGRAAAINMLPTTTGAATATTKVLPELKGKICGMAVRIPTPVVSITDLVAQVKKETTKEEVNNLFKKAEKELKGILATQDLPLVSTDYIGNTHSAIIDTQSTLVQDKTLVKVLGWYDNEYGYSCRLAEFAEFIGNKI
ncbi:MAG: type I glyceraldehyde-3-phosphate dehydrogenase [Candidatus Portnoybacteria bacterium]|nr:type I glyceraldehyde-3-phosphate dehydrogenase [Candidatus Portnoybacteria bacterium]